MQENPDIWSLKPFPSSLLKPFVLKAAYLLLLHASLMDNLMSDLTTYLSAYWTGSGDHLVSTKMRMKMKIEKNRREIKRKASVEPHVFGKLADMQELRREKAIEDYRMKEDGLLIQQAMEFNREKQSTEG